jgi:hypothetical protein
MRRAARRSAHDPLVRMGIVAIEQAGDQTQPSFSSLLRSIVVIYLPWLLCALAFASGVEAVRGIFFSHSGLGLLLLWLSAPWALVSTLTLVFQARRAQERSRARNSLLIGCAYPLLAWPFAGFLRWALTPPFTDTTLDYYFLVMSPVGRLIGG